MGIVIGIDVGGSTTKIVGIEEGELRTPMLVRAADPVTSLFGALGKFLYAGGFGLEDVERVMLTGVGSASVGRELYGLPTGHVDEFRANGLGARFGTGLTRLMVVSMGTGSSFVRVADGEIRHIGGTAIGGGTMQGLARLLLQTNDIRRVSEMAARGDVRHVNLQIEDICNSPLPGLPSDATASAFGKAEADASPDDVAAGIVHLVLQGVGQCAALAATGTDIRDFVLIGNLARLPQCAEVFDGLAALHGCRFHIPPHAEFRTALGAALAAFEE